MRVRVIARRAGWANLQRHYPPSAKNPRAGHEFVIEAHKFSAKWMRISPHSKFNIEQVLAAQKKYWKEKVASGEFKSDQRGFKLNEAQLAKKGIFKQPFVPPKDEGELAEEDPEEEVATYAGIQKAADARKPPARTVEEAMKLESKKPKISESSKEKKVGEKSKGTGNQEVI